MCSTWGALKGYERYFPSGRMKIWKIAKYTPCSQRIASGSPHKLPFTKVRLAHNRGEYGGGACTILGPLAGSVWSNGPAKWARNTIHGTYHILPQKVAPTTICHAPSKGITLCQSLIGTQGEFLCNTNTCALHSKVILTHAMSWPKSYNANSTLLTMIHYTSAHVWKRMAYKAS